MTVDERYTAFVRDLALNLREQEHEKETMRWADDGGPVLDRDPEFRRPLWDRFR